MINPALALDRTVLVLKDYVAAPDAAVVEALTTLRVRLTASAETLAAPNARVALLAAFETISRLGAQIVLEIPPDVPVDVAVPPLAPPPTTLARAFEHLSSRLIRPLAVDGDCDLTFTFDRGRSAGAIAIGASDFQGRLRVAADGGDFDGRLPFGAVLAGASAGAEVARLAVARLIEAGFEPVDTIPLDAADVTLSLAPFAYPVDGVDLGRIDFVSAGAVTHASLFTLARVPGLVLTGRVFDDDAAAVDNLNRYVLLDTDGLGQLKESHLASLAWPRFDLRGVHGRVGEGDLAAVELASRVLVGVDSVEARWAIQRLAPEWVGVGATSHALAMVSQHWPETPCAGCVHPQASPLAARLPTISFVSLIAGALLAHRLVQAAVAPEHSTRVDYVLDALRLSAAEPFITELPQASERCPVCCRASRDLSPSPHRS